MKRYDFAKDVAYLLLSDLREQKRRQVERRVTDALCARILSGQEGVINETLLILRRFYDTYATTHEQLNTLLHAAYEVFYRKKRLSVIMKLFTNAALNTERSTKLKKAQEWCTIQFFRYTGTTLDRSMEWALFLLETFGGSEQMFTQKPTPSFEKDPSAVQMSTVMEIVRMSAESPPSPFTPQKLWFERIAESIESNPAAEEVMVALLNMLAAFHPSNEIYPGVPPITIHDRATLAAVEQILADAKQKRGGAPWVLFSQRDILDRFQKWNGQHTAKWQPRTIAGVRSLEHFVAHIDDFERVRELRCRAIKERVRYGLRPGGLDHIDIAVEALAIAGVRSIAFHSEAYRFPNVGLRVIVRKLTPHLIVFPGVLIDFELRLDADTLHTKNFDTASLILVHDLFEHVVIDILYRIVCGKGTLRPKRQERTGDRKDGAPSSDGETKPIRPHFRHLPEGWHASAGAVERGLATFGWLPPGSTFVKGGVFVPAQYRDGRITHTLPTEPFAIYGDEDFMDTTDPV